MLKYVPAFGGKPYLAIHTMFRKLIGEDEFTRKLYFEYTNLFEAGDVCYPVKNIYKWSYRNAFQGLIKENNYN